MCTWGKKCASRKYIWACTSCRQKCRNRRNTKTNPSSVRVEKSPWSNQLRKIFLYKNKTLSFFQFLLLTWKSKSHDSQSITENKQSTTSSASQIRFSVSFHQRMSLLVTLRYVIEIKIFASHFHFIKQYNFKCLNKDTKLYFFRFPGFNFVNVSWHSTSAPSRAFAVKFYVSI